MKKFLLILGSIMLFGISGQAEPLTGGVTEVGLGNKVVDAKPMPPSAELKYLYQSKATRHIRILTGISTLMQILTVIR